MSKSLRDRLFGPRSKQGESRGGQPSTPAEPTIDDLDAKIKQLAGELEASLTTTSPIAVNQKNETAYALGEGDDLTHKSIPSELPAEEIAPEISVHHQHESPIYRIRHQNKMRSIIRIRGQVNPILGLVLSTLPFVFLMIWWYFMTIGAEPELRRISPTILPSPHELYQELGNLFTTGRLGYNILVSLVRVMFGFGIAAVIALPLGVMMGACGKINATFNRMMTVLSFLPVPAIVPLTLSWWGSGEEQKIGFLALVTFAALLPAIYHSITKVEHRYLLSSYTQGASAWDAIRRVLLPIALPDIYTAMRTCLGVGWTYIVLVEVIKSGDEAGGVGNMIMVYHRRGFMPEVYLTVIAIMLIGALIDMVCRFGQKKLFPWQRGGQSGR